MEKSNYHSNVNHHKRHMKQSGEKRAFLWAFIISFTVCTLFLGWRLVSVLEATQLPPIPATHTGSGTGVAENPEENTLATAKEQGDEQEWSLILVNRQNPIPAQYDVELEQLSNGERIDIRISPYLQDLFDAARADGVYPIVASGYRTTEKQQEIMDEKVAEYKAKGYTSAQAKAEAETWVAVPGTSEHQLGLAVDINADGIHSTRFTDGWMKTAIALVLFAATRQTRQR